MGNRKEPIFPYSLVSTFEKFPVIHQCFLFAGAQRIPGQDFFLVSFLCGLLGRGNLKKLAWMISQGTQQHRLAFYIRFARFLYGSYPAGYMKGVRLNLASFVWATTQHSDSTARLILTGMAGGRCRGIHHLWRSDSHEFQTTFPRVAPHGHGMTSVQRNDVFLW